MTTAVAEKAAEDVLTRLVPEGANTDLDQGFILARAGRFGAALKAFDRVIAADAKLAAVAYMYQASIRANMGHPQKAIRAAENSVACSDRDFAPSATLFLAHTLAAGSQQTKAIDAYDRVLEFDCDREIAVVAHWYKSEMYAMLDRYNEMFDAYHNAIELYPEHAASLYLSDERRTGYVHPLRFLAILFLNTLARKDDLFGQAYLSFVNIVFKTTPPKFNYGTLGTSIVGTPEAIEYLASQVPSTKRAAFRGKIFAALREAKGHLTRDTTERAKVEPRPKAAGSESAPLARTAQELFGVSPSSPSRRYHRSKGAEFSAEELDDPVLLHAADSAVNDRSKRTKNGEALSPEVIEIAQKAARFARQARRRREKFAKSP